jgi:NADPH:quinone reductase-like Zn-dependent oxidoreductase
MFDNCVSMAPSDILYRLPFKLGYDVSGTIEAVGSAVSGDLKPGMEVYSRVPEEYRGTASEFVVSTDKTTAQKPSSLSHIESASLPLVALTALRVLDIAEKHVPGGLKGKTVLIPAGLSGVGSIAIQLAKRVFQAGKVITTLSTAKIAKVDNLLGEGLLDQIVDYTKDIPVKTIAAGSVDFMFDITDEAMTFLPIMKKGGLILTVAGVPFGDSLRETMPNMPFLPRYGLLAYGSYLQFRAGRYGVSFHHVFMRPSAEDLARLRGWVDQGIVKPLVGKTAPLKDIKVIREACEEIHSGKGGTGKFVIVVQN